MPIKSNIQAVNDALHVAMGRDENILVLGEDVGKLGGVFRATQGLQKTYGERRVMDTPLAEAGIVGVSTAMAMYGLKPVCEIQFLGFLFPAMNQLFAHAARMRNRSRSRFTVPMVLRSPCGAGIHAPEHHSESIEALCAHIPGLKIVMPSTPHDMKGLLLAAIEDPDPVIFLEHSRIYRAVKGEVPEGYYTVPLGKADVVQTGTDVTIIAWGAMRHLAEKLAKSYAERGVSVEVVDIRSIVPLDIETILQSVTKTGRAVIVHEAPRSCGMGAEIASLIYEKALFSLRAPIERVTAWDITVPLPKGEHMYIPDEARVTAAVERVLQYN